MSHSERRIVLAWLCGEKGEKSIKTMTRAQVFALCEMLISAEPRNTLLPNASAELEALRLRALEDYGQLALFTTGSNEETHARTTECLD